MLGHFGLLQRSCGAKRHLISLGTIVHQEGHYLSGSNHQLPDVNNQTRGPGPQRVEALEFYAKSFYGEQCNVTDETSLSLLHMLKLLKLIPQYKAEPFYD